MGGEEGEDDEEAGNDEGEDDEGGGGEAVGYH
jgi:hypothetical protein